MDAAWTQTITPSASDGVVIFRGLTAKTSYLATISSLMGVGADATFGALTASTLAVTNPAQATSDIAVTHKYPISISGVTMYLLLSNV